MRTHPTAEKKRRTREKSKSGARKISSRKPAASRARSEIDTRAKIIAAAETLFSERGFDAVGMRDITSKAQVNLALINYHFGSKKALLEEVVTRHAVQVVQRRLELLSQVSRDKNNRPKLEAIVSAFLRPAFELAQRPSGAAYLRIRARLALEPVGAALARFNKTYEASHQKFVDALEEALPGVSRAEIYWGFHCLAGVVVYTMANSGRIQQLSNGVCKTDDLEETLAHLVPFVASGFLNLRRHIE